MKTREIPISIYHSYRLRYFSRNQTGNKIPVVVSLTSIPSRLGSLDIVVNSLLEQDHEPELIVLWLNHSLEDNIPERLVRLESDTFKIRFCDGTSSFRKLLPSLKAYPDSCIVTCDDDMIYPRNWLGCLYNAHLANEKSVISQVGRLIKRGSDEELLSYKDWEFVRYECSQTNFLPIGYGGVLYPKKVFNEYVHDEATFLKACPTADDLWFKAMALVCGTGAYCASEKAIPIPIIGSQKVSLKKKNISQDKNREQWNNLCELYPLLKNI